MNPVDWLTGTWPLYPSIAAFGVCAVVLIVLGSRFARVVDRLADRTGIGEAIAGVVLLGATTSMPGLITTVVSAYEGKAELAVSNALGGIAAQTAFLAVADILYRRANLEHAAASLPNMLQTMVLIALSALVVLGASGPDFSWLGIHPVTLALPVVYIYGLWLTRQTRDNPMWSPAHTAETRLDEPQEGPDQESLARLWGAFLLLAGVVALTGFVVARAGLSILRDTGLSETFIGGYITSVVTSLPELVTVIAAVRAGALTLAVGDIIGGNTFDVLFVAAADVAYREGSVYHALGPSTLFVTALAVLLTAVLAAGLIYRQKTGVGFEGLVILVLYALGFTVLFFFTGG
ncbi:MAG: sodium:calcium antiporter [Candidatus Competibacteraceae bacterium]|nr:sodium:calcium antiporter [Candidatus Competibacteraceae bacterium]